MDDRERGLYGKYEAYRIRDGRRAEPVFDFFLLRVGSDPFAVPALRAYADACEAEYPLLARDLREWVKLAPPTPPAPATPPPAHAGDAAEADVVALVEALQAVSDGGYPHGECAFCNAEHYRDRGYDHDDDCPMLLVDRALAARRGEGGKSG